MKCSSFINGVFYCLNSWNAQKNACLHVLQTYLSIFSLPNLSNFTIFLWKWSHKPLVRSIKFYNYFWRHFWTELLFLFVLHVMVHKRMRLKVKNIIFFLFKTESCLILLWNDTLMFILNIHHDIAFHTTWYWLGQN